MMLRSFTVKPLSYQQYDTIFSSCSTTRLNKNVSLKHKKYVQIPIEDVRRKHTERSIISYETDELTGQLQIAYKSVSQSKAILKDDREKVALPRQHYQKIESILSSFENQDDKTVTCEANPVLEDDFTYKNPPYPSCSQSRDPPTSYCENIDDQQNSSGVVTENPLAKYKYYPERKRSFERCIYIAKPDQENLSKTGFFYTGAKDKVRCFSCGIGLKDLTVDMDPEEEHVRHSDNCPFLSHHLGQRLTTVKTDLCKSDAEYYRKWQYSKENQCPIYDSNFEKIKDRIASLDRWPLATYEHSVAEAGFYYSGFEADVRCYACDGGFRKLKSVDDLWLDHCFYFPSCLYLESKVGTHFLNQVNEMTSAIHPKEENLIATGGATMREISSENHSYLKSQCLEMGFQERDVDNALTQMVIRGYRHNIGPLLELLTQNGNCNQLGKYC